MKVKALVSFSGLVTMTKGETKEIKDKDICEDLLKANYIQEVKSKRSNQTNKKQKVNTDED